MSDEDFDFRRPAERREPKEFQPPPWEEDAFQQLQKERAPERRQQDPEATGDPELKAAPKLETVVPEVRTAEPVVVDRRQPARQVDEAAMIEMLAGLSAEDPPATRGILKVAVGSALVLFAIGGMMLIWAMAALVGSRTTGTFGVMAALTLAVFGAGFIGAGWWLMHRTLKRRGVL